MEAGHSVDRQAATPSTKRLHVLLFLLVLASVGPIVHEYTDQPASRYTLSAALWENQSVALDGFEHAIGRDSAAKDGHFYSDKAPLQPFLGVPFYGLLHTFGAESASVVRSERNLGQWWQTFWSAAVPLALLCVVLLVGLRRVGLNAALAATLSVAFGTILLPFGAMLFGHVLAALFVTAAVVMLLRDELGWAHLVAAGALAGAAVATEYPAALAVVAMTGFVLWKVRLRVYWYILGGLPFVAFLAIYHTAAFGSPLSHPYTYTAFFGVPSEQGGFLDVFAGFQPDNLFRILFSGRGFVMASPIVVAGLIGLVYLLRRGSKRQQAAASLSLAVFVAMLLVPLCWGNPWGGFSPGPRYLTPALPVVAFGVAAVWSFRPFLMRVAVGLSGLTMVLAVVTNPLVDKAGQGGIGTWLGLVAEGRFVDTIFTMAFGIWGWLVHGVLVGTLGWMLYRTSLRERSPVSDSMKPARETVPR